MFGRGTSSPGKIRRRVNINKNMCLGFADMYIDGKPYQSGFNGSCLDIYRDKEIKTISISGRISYPNPKNEYDIISGISGGITDGTLTYRYNSGMRCESADKVTYGNGITGFVPATVTEDPGKIIDFTYGSELHTRVLDESHVSRDGDCVLNDNCMVTDLCSGRESYACGKSSRGNRRVTVRTV